jgi:plastocyanin
MKKFVGLIAVFVLLAGACGDDEEQAEGPADSSPKGPLTYNVAVDAASPEGKNISLSAYFPGGLKVHAGDTVVFDNKSTQAPHTISFGINSDRSNSPAPFTKKGAFNPAVFGPCTTSAEPTGALEACPEPPAAPLPPYSGKGYWNSGALVPAVAPAGVKQVSVKFDASTPPGSYNYACILHGPMGGSVTVVGPGDARDTPEAAAASGAKSAGDLIASVVATPDPAATAGNVIAGMDKMPATVNRFFPGAIEIKAGGTVTWKSVSVIDPHTITFEPPFTAPEDPRAIPPAGVKVGGSYTTGFTNSGVLGPTPPFPGDTFSLRFPKKGSYNYLCGLHPGMVGTVNVT